MREESLEIAETFQARDEYIRPPLPYDSVASTKRSEQAPKTFGVVTITVGAKGLTGASVLVRPEVAGGLRIHDSAGPAQKALISPPTRRTMLPTPRRGPVSISFAGGLDAMLTVLESSQEHCVALAPTKSKRVLQGHEGVSIPAPSVGESKYTKAVWPLSEN